MSQYWSVELYQSFAVAPNAAQLELICSIDVESALLISWSLTTKLVPGRCYTDDVTVVSICPDANAQCHLLMHRYSGNAEQLSRSCFAPAPAMLLKCQTLLSKCLDDHVQLSRSCCEESHALQSWKTGALTQLTRLSCEASTTLVRCCSKLLLSFPDAIVYVT
jgi:hypothetical protein